ncbi:protein D1-like [Littorina saxatilis]|uniref:Phosphatidylethanolamine-binding protein n=1 Tax=Littorina saxatilis TaxID=31220 RepID=A0AAN9G1T8_9CAEN
MVPNIAQMLGLALTLTLLSTPSLSSPAILPPTKDGSRSTARSDCLPDQECTDGFNVRFGNLDVECGRKLDDEQVTDVPVLDFTVPDDRDTSSDVESQSPQGAMLLMLVDPDAPSASDCPNTYWLHWMAQVRFQDGMMKVEQTLVDFSPPSPPSGSGPHRYQVLLHVLKDDVPKVAVPGTRSAFDLDTFTKSIKGIGELQASFQFRVDCGKRE